MKNLSNRTKVQMFKARQRKGDITLIADNTGYSIYHVSNVLANRKSNSMIVDAAYKLAYRRKTNAQLA